MQVICLVLVIVFAGQACHGFQGPSYTIGRARRGSTLRDYPGHRKLDTNRLKKLNKGIKRKDFSDEQGDLHPFAGVLHNLADTPSSVRTSSHSRDGLPIVKSSSVPLYLTPPKPPAAPRRLLHPPARNSGVEEEVTRAPWPHIKPASPFHFPVDLDEGKPCRNSPPGMVDSVPTAPPQVCDLCPSEQGMNPLDPCTCVGVGGSSAGMISISCPSETVSLDQLSDIFHNTNFITTHVFQFSLQGSSANGALTRDIWGELDFKYVFINHNKITDVDNGAFISSKDTLISLDLANNEIKSYIALYNDLPNLLYLNLAGNNISLIYSEDFQYPKLTDLDLSHNQITSIGMHSFAALKKLRSLNLSYNLLTSIGDERFTFIDHDYTNVLVIDLSSNKISHLSETAFLGIQSVEIDFRSNQLHTLQETIFSPIIQDSHYFVYFHFMDNQMICDCGLMWVVADGNNLFCFDNFQCTNNNQTLYTLEPSDLGNCSGRARLL